MPVAVAVDVGGHRGDDDGEADDDDRAAVATAKRRPHVAQRCHRRFTIIIILFVIRIYLRHLTTPFLLARLSFQLNLEKKINLLCKKNPS